MLAMSNYPVHSVVLLLLSVAAAIYTCCLDD